MNTKQALAILQEPNGSEKLAAKAEEAFAPSLSLLTQEEAAAAAFLVRLAKQKRYRQEINRWLGDRSLLYRLLGSDDAKMRKNTARLMGRLLVPDDAGPLVEALKHESKRLVRPSMILALGALKTPEAVAFLKDYQVEPAAGPEEVKHERAEREALDTVLSGFRSLPEHVFADLPGRTGLELRCSRGLEKMLAAELSEVAEAEGAGTLSVRGVYPGRVTVTVSKWKALGRSRIWREALFPLARNVRREPEAIGTAAASKVLTTLRAVLGPELPYAFRVEMADKPLVKEVSRALADQSAGALVNSPSNYEVELRVEPHGADEDWVDLYLKLYTAPDERFAYRKAAVLAAMHPANAAGVIRLAKPYLKSNALVLDPCCGGGTLLIERALYGKANGHPCRGLIGVDLQDKALKIAMKNLKAARLGGRLIRNDMLQFKPQEPLDEIFANLPFGIRIGSHKENLKLYQGLAERLPLWLKPGGIAVLYTMEGKLLERCLYSQRRLQILERHTIEAGGLDPKIFIVKNL